MLSSHFSNIRRTQFNQSSPVQPVACQKERKKCCPLSLPIIGGRDSTRALQSSPFQISGGVPWASQMKDKRRTKEILVSNLGLQRDRIICLWLLPTQAISYPKQICSFFKYGHDLVHSLLSFYQLPAAKRLHRAVYLLMHRMYPDQTYTLFLIY